MYCLPGLLFTHERVQEHCISANSMRIKLSNRKLLDEVHRSIYRALQLPKARTVVSCSGFLSSGGGAGPREGETFASPEPRHRENLSKIHRFLMFSAFFGLELAISSTETYKTGRFPPFSAFGRWCRSARLHHRFPIGPQFRHAPDDVVEVLVRQLASRGSV